MTATRTTREKAAMWEVVSPLLLAMQREFKDFSAKKPEGAVGKSKIVMVGRLLERCREVLRDEASLEFLDEIDADDVPQNSDVVLVLSQYAAAMTQFRATYHSGGLDDEWLLFE